MPQLGLAAHTTILSTTSRTVLNQTFVNPSKSDVIDQASYTFPLYDGVSVVGFTCCVGDRVIHGLVKEKEQARADYKEAVDRGETAGLLEQLPEASDVFTTRIGNIPAKEKVIVEITYLGELKHDAEVDGARFTIPTAIASRYGTVSNSQVGLQEDTYHPTNTAGIEITVDVAVDEASVIRGLQSPSHPIRVTLGRTSKMSEDAFDTHHASANLALGTTELDKDFILLVLAKEQALPRALLETHPEIPNQRALMATLVPKYNLPSIRPEIVFVADRSGSMNDKIPTLKSALRVFLKSLPVGVKFNICSFGSNHSFLWPRSKTYEQSSLDQALKHVNSFGADFGGTEMFEPLKDTVENRYKDMQLEVMVITDGQIWNQQQLFDFINKAAAENPIRFFSLGIGDSASHSLVEGIARAGDGFSQSVGEGEKLDKKVVKMLKGALTPHIKDYTVEVKYEKADEDYEIVDSVTESLRDMVTDAEKRDHDNPAPKKPTSLFDPAATTEEKPDSEDTTGQGRYSYLPKVNVPKLLQAPHKIPSLYPFNRTVIYLLMSSETCQKAPQSVVLRATSENGPLELEIPVQDVGKGQTIHQMAAKKAVSELEEGRGWLFDAKDKDGKQIRSQFDGRWDEMVEREAVRLGVQFQVGGKWCSFVVVEKNFSTLEKNVTLQMGDIRMTENEGDARHTDTGHVAFGAPRARAAGFGLFGGSGSKGGSTRDGYKATSSPLHSSRSVLASTAARKSAPGPPMQSQNVGAFYGARKSAPADPSGSASLFGGFGGNVAQGTGSGGFGQASTPAAQPSSQSLFGSASQASSQSTFGNAVQAAPRAVSLSPSNPSYFALPMTLLAEADLRQEFMMSRIKPSDTASANSLFSQQPLQPQQTGFMQQAAFQQSLQPSQAQSQPKMRKQAARATVGGKACRRSQRFFRGEDVEVEEHDDMEIDGNENSAPGPQTDEKKMHAIITLQSFEGSWSWEEKLFAILGLEPHEVETILSSGAGLKDDEKVVFATILAVAFLEKKVAREKDAWELVVEKAEGWLAGSIYKKGVRDETERVKKAFFKDL